MSTTKSIIPIKNLFYMLCYAWNVLSIKDDVLVGLDDYDDAYNVLGRVFSYGIGKLIRSGFHNSYIPQEEELSTLRGKINIQESINRLSYQRKKLVCDYDEYLKNDLFNQIIKYTISVLLKNPDVDPKIKESLKKQIIYFADVEESAPTKSNRAKLSFNRNNTTYKLLISIAVLLYDNTTINEEDGRITFSDFYREENMQRVYEKFILNFYSIHLDGTTYRVYAPKVTWLKSSEEDLWEDIVEDDSHMPEMRTDIVIENKASGIQFIIDAKYYAEAMVEGHRTKAKKFRRDHISQIFTYMANSTFVGTKRGALLYPTVEDVIDEKQNILTGWVFFKSINLDSEWREISAQLLSFAQRAD